MKLKLLAFLLGLIAFGLLLLAARGSVINPVTSDLETLTRFSLGQIAQVQVMSDYDGKIVLVSPTGETLDLRTEEPIFVPTDEVEEYFVRRLDGEAEWLQIYVTSYDTRGGSHWVLLEGDGSQWITTAGNTAITSYNWD